MEESFWPNKCQKIEFGKFSREQPRKKLEWINKNICGVENQQGVI